MLKIIQDGAGKGTSHSFSTKLCEFCVKMRQEFGHNCLRHCNCVDKETGGWNPSLCRCCITLSKRTEDYSTAPKYQAIIKQLSGRVAEKCQKTNFSTEGTFWQSLHAMEVWSRPWLCSLVYLRTKSKPDKEIGSGGSVMEKDVTAAELNVTNPAGPTDALSTQVPRTMILTPRSKRDVASFEQY